MLPHDPGFVSGFIGVSIDVAIHHIFHHVSIALRCKGELNSLRDLVMRIEPIIKQIQQYRLALNRKRGIPISQSDINMKASAVNEWLKKLDNLLRINRLDIPLEFLVACFDGATQINVLCNDAGGIIKLSTSIVYKWYLNSAKGTNTKAELMGAWATLYLSNLLSIHKLQILGDSKVIIDWLNHKSELWVSSLEGCKQRIRLLRRKFLVIQFFHIFHEFNKEANGLSKKALLAPEGNISLHL